VNSRSKQGWTPLHVASKFGHLEVSQILIDHGADVGAVNSKGQTPYQLSLAYGYREIGNLLREHGTGRERFEDILLWLQCDLTGTSIPFNPQRQHSLREALVPPNGEYYSICLVSRMLIRAPLPGNSSICRCDSGQIPLLYC